MRALTSFIQYSTKENKIVTICTYMYLYTEIFKALMKEKRKDYLHSQIGGILLKHPFHQK